MKRGVIIFFDFLILLIFELGEDEFASCLDAYSPGLADSCCYLDNQEWVQGLYVSATSRSVVMLNFRRLDHSGTPLLRVIYRDSKFVRRRTSIETAFNKCSHQV